MPGGFIVEDYFFFFKENVLSLQCSWEEQDTTLSS